MLDDGLHLITEGDGKLKEDASNDACLNMLVELMLVNPDGVRLMDKHWSIPVEEVRNIANNARAAGFGTGPARDRGTARLPSVSVRASRYEPPQAGHEGERESDVVDILRRCCGRAKDGVAKPYHLADKTYTELEVLVQPGYLKKIIAELPDFHIVELDGNKWGFELAGATY